MKKLSSGDESKRVLQSLLPYGRSSLLVSTGAGVVATLGLILQSFAFARSIQLCGIERADLAHIVPWLFVFAWGMGIRGCCSYLAGRFSAEGALRIQHSVRRTILDTLFSSHASMVEQGEHQTAETAHTLLEQVDTLEPYYARYMPALWLAVLSPLLFLLVIFPTNWLVGLMLLLATPAIPFYMSLIGMGAETKSRQHMQTTRLLSATFLDYLQGIQTVKALGAVERASSSIAEASHELSRRSMGVQRIALLSSAVLEFFSTFAIAIVATYIGLSLLKYLQLGPILPDMTLQTGLFLLLLAPAYFQPLRTFAAAYHDRADALAATEHLLPFLASSSNSEEIQHQRSAEQVINTVQQLELREVMLHYTRRTAPTLSDVNLVVHAGERVAIVGPSGAGKTSLLALMTGRVVPTQGEMRVNGEHSSKAMVVESSWISQRPYLFPGTLAENIALGQPDRSREEIEEAARKAQVIDFASRLPAGLDTPLGERGQGLSGGEAQRVALARAFLKDASLLVLDEPTAHLDAETEAKLIDVLATLMQGKTVLLATHRPALLPLCNRVLRLDEGMLVEEPTQHEERIHA